MSVLGIDGALGAFSAAIARDGAIVACRDERGNVALERGLQLVAETLREASVEGRDLDRIAVGCGPGSFTGLRIAISYAKALAQAWSRPLVAVNTFELLEYGRALERVLTVVQGRPGVVSARYRDGEAMVRASGWVSDVLDQLAAALDSGGPELPVIGAPEDVLCALAERGIVALPLSPTVASAASAAALAAALRDPAPSVHAVRADYGELPAARVPRLKT